MIRKLNIINSILYSRAYVNQGLIGYKLISVFKRFTGFLSPFLYILGTSNINFFSNKNLGLNRRGEGTFNLSMIPFFQIDKPFFITSSSKDTCLDVHSNLLQTIEVCTEQSESSFSLFNTENNLLHFTLNFEL